MRKPLFHHNAIVSAARMLNDQGDNHAFPPDVDHQRGHLHGAQETRRGETFSPRANARAIARLQPDLHRLRSHPPSTLLGAEVATEDLLPDADVVRLSWSAAAARKVSQAPRRIVRPSSLSRWASLAIDVVLPEPLTPAIR